MLSGFHMVASGRIRLAATLAAAWLSAPGSAAAEPLKVVATIKPVHALVAMVMGSVDSPAVIVGGSASPHTYALRPSDAAAINGANIVFRLSPTLEPFTGKIVRTLPKTTTVVTLEDAPGVALLPVRSGGAFEADAHDHGKSGHNSGHDHAHNTTAAKKASKDAAVGPRDPHVWLSPDNAVALIDRIASALTDRFPAHAAAFKANAETAKTDIRALDRELANELAPVAGRPYVVFHDAYQYFEARFGLTPVGSITTNPDVPPSGKRLAALRNKVRTLSAACIFSEPNFEARVVNSVAEGTTAKTAVLDPEGALIPAGPAFYATLMRSMARGFKSCLAPAS